MNLASLVTSGVPQSAARRIPLRAGPLALFFIEETASLRDIRLGDREVIRRIYVAVRDRNWGTLATRIEGLRIETGPDSFRIAFDAACREEEIDYFWKGAIDGEADGTIKFRFDGEARSTFLKNRIGLCVLHPIEGCAGEPCEIEKIDGTIERGTFPRLIEPHQPFRGIRAIRHQVGADLRAEVRLEGDTFEMEDQRNWSDASYKTYSTPLELPFPAKVERGARVSQSATLKLLGSRPATVARRAGAEACEVTVPSQPTLDRPPVGLRMAGHGVSLTTQEVERLRLLGLDHLRAELDYGNPEWPAILQRAIREAALLGSSLHIALFLSGDAAGGLEELDEALLSAGVRPSMFLVDHQAEKAAVKRLRRFMPEVPIAVGTSGNFAEQNRSRPSFDSPAHPCWSMNPQAHAFDNATIAESLDGAPFAVETARTFSSRPAVISPITLRPRSDPLLVDPRQLSLFLAGWTLASIARLGATGWVHSLTYYETTGWLGVMEREEGDAPPEEFPSIPGGVFPVFHALADISGFDRMAPAGSSEPLRIEALALFDRAGRSRVLLANLSDEKRTVRLLMGARRGRIHMLDASNAEEAMRRPEAFRLLPGEVRESSSGVLEIRLGPCALARIDLEN